MTASGTFGYGTEFAERQSLSGLGAVVCKGTTRLPRTGNEPLRMIETSAGMLNAIGLQNIGVEAVVRDKAPIWTSWQVPVIVNVSGTTVEEYVEVISQLNGVAGVAGIELNVSCPNVREESVMFGADERLLRDVTAAARKATVLPLVVKLSPNVADIRRLAAAVEGEGADAVSLINTVYGMAMDRRRRGPSLTSGSGGISGPAIKPLALYLVSEVAQAVSIPVIGVGGIMTGLDAVHFILAGATAIQIGTALLIDPFCWREIVAEIEAWCRKEGVGDLTEVIGAGNSGFKRRAGELSPAGSS